MVNICEIAHAQAFLDVIQGVALTAWRKQAESAQLEDCLTTSCTSVPTVAHPMKDPAETRAATSE